MKDAGLRHMIEETDTKDKCKLIKPKPDEFKLITISLYSNDNLKFT